MLEIIIAILLSIGIKSDGSDIQILSDAMTPTGVEQVTFMDNSNGTTYTMNGTEQNGWGIQPNGAAPASGTGPASATGGTEQNGWGVTQ
jgi:hypothetical protein